MSSPSQTPQDSPRSARPDAAARTLPSLEDLGALERAIHEVVGASAADETLFQVGRAWGEREAATLARDAPADSSLRQRIEFGLERASELALGGVRIETLELAPQRRYCRLVGWLGDPPRRAPADSRSQAGCGAACGLSAGFLTGMAAALTGMDLVCSMSLGAGPEECRFEIRSAHVPEVAAADESAPVAPAGSARFFLGAMGKALATEDIALDELLENTPDALILIDSHNLIRFWNRGAEDMFGYQREDVVGRPIGFIVPRDLVASDELGHLQSALETSGSVCNFITRREHKDGHELWVSLTRTLLHDRRGQVVGSTATLRDITEQRRTEEELQQARGMALLGEFSAKLADEIKNPLAGIYAAVQMLARELEPGDARVAVFAELGCEILRLDERIQDLLRFARPRPPRPQPTDLRTFVLDSLTALRARPELAGHQVQISIEDGLVLALDARLMGQAFNNLVLNAAQAMQSPGILSIVAVQAVDHVVIDVSDTGPGVPSDRRERVFEPLYSTRAHGGGLGLAIARKNVEAHGGSLHLEAQEGPGARFRITLPCDCSRAHPAGIEHR